MLTAKSRQSSAVIVITPPLWNTGKELIVRKPWYRRRTVWCAVGFAIVHGLNVCGVIPPGIAEALLGLLGAGGVVALRASVESAKK